MMRTEIIEDYSGYRYFAVVLRVQNRYTREIKTVKKCCFTKNGDLPKITNMLGLIPEDSQVGNCSVVSVEELMTRNEYLKIKKK